jgi:RNA polymerase sigma-70 factor (ECF subfamily)
VAGSVDSRTEPSHPEFMSFSGHAGSLPNVETARNEELVPRELNDLARAALAGDPQAVRQFLNAITPLVCTVCRGVMGRQSPDLEDAVQDCLVDVALALPRFRFESDVTHYVTKVTLRRAISVRERARAQSNRITTMDAHDLPPVLVDNGNEARADLLRDLLDDLNKEQANVLRLRLMLGHSIDEIAGITGVSQNTVKTRLRLGKIQMRRWLERLGEGRRARR